MFSEVYSQTGDTVIKPFAFIANVLYIPLVTSFLIASLVQSMSTQPVVLNALYPIVFLSPILFMAQRPLPMFVIRKKKSNGSNTKLVKVYTAFVVLFYVCLLINFVAVSYMVEHMAGYATIQPTSAVYNTALDSFRVSLLIILPIIPIVLFGISCAKLCLFKTKLSRKGKDHLKSSSGGMIDESNYQKVQDRLTALSIDLAFGEKNKEILSSIVINVKKNKVSYDPGSNRELNTWIMKNVKPNETLLWLFGWVLGWFEVGFGFYCWTSGVPYSVPVWGTIDSPNAVLIGAVWLWVLHPIATTQSQQRRVTLLVYLMIGLSLSVSAWVFDIQRVSTVGVYYDIASYIEMFDVLGSSPPNITTFPIQNVFTFTLSTNTSIRTFAEQAIMNNFMHMGWIGLGFSLFGIIAAKSIKK